MSTLALRINAFKTMFKFKFSLFLQIDCSFLLLPEALCPGLYTVVIIQTVWNFCQIILTPYLDTSSQKYDAQKCDAQKYGAQKMCCTKMWCTENVVHNVYSYFWWIPKFTLFWFRHFYAYVCLTQADLFQFFSSPACSTRLNFS